MEEGLATFTFMHVDLHVHVRDGAGAKLMQKQERAATR